MKLKVGNTYEINNGSVYKCTVMYGDDPMGVDECGFGPFIINNNCYQIDGTFGSGGVEELNVKRCLEDDKGQTLSDLNVKEGDVVECVESKGGSYTYEGTINTVNKNLGTKNDDPNNKGGFMPDNPHLWRILSRASDKWITEEPATTDGYDVSYYMGVAIAWRKQPEPEPVIEVVKRRVRVCDDGFIVNEPKCSGPNATLKGVTKDGKPVGMWTIQMD